MLLNKELTMFDISIAFKDQFQTEKHLEQFISNLLPQDRAPVAQKIGTILYGFDILYGNSQWIVYKSHTQAMTFIKKFNKKAKKSLTLQGIQQGSISVSSTDRMAEEQWFQDFCEIDQSDKETGNYKRKKLQMKKKAGGRYFRYRCCNCCAWKQCTILIRKDGLVYKKGSKNTIKQFMHFGKDFTFQLGSNFDFLQVIIHAYHRKLSLRAKDEKDYLLFVYYLTSTLLEYKKNQQQYRFNSFAPIRSHNDVSLFVDGEDYFESVAHALESAQQQIFICGWWVSPQFHLIRPCQGKNLDYRLDNLLRRIAKKNVKVYIIVYYESRFIANDSAYTKEALEQLHENIKVIRHPNIILPTFWSHHEKLVVVDQMIAHMGGLDLCYGRYDDHIHSIDDNSENVHPGIEYNNSRMKDIVNVRDYRSSSIQRTEPRLPWHDIALRVQGQCVKDLSRHFIEYWNYASYQIYYADRYILLAKPENSEKKKNHPILQKFRGLAKEIKIKIKPEQVEKRASLQAQKFQRSSKNSPQNLSEPKMYQQEDQIIQNQIELRFPPERKKRQSFSDKIMATISPQRIRHSPKIFSPSSENLNHQRQINQIVQDTNLQRSPSQLKQTSKYQPQTNDRKLETGYKLQDHPRSSIQNHRNSDIKKQLNQFVQIGDTDEKMSASEYEKKLNKFHQNMIKVAEIEKKIEEEIDHEENSFQSQYIMERDHLQIQKKHYSLIQENSFHDNPNRLENFMHKLINKVKKSHENNENQQRESRENKMDDISAKNYGQDQQIKDKFKDRCQILRSASQWSIGCKYDKTEMSIQEGYLRAIANAKKYIYIENQFFISATKNNGVVKNRIVEALAQKIISCIQKKEEFRVVIFVPLLPGFAGELDDPATALLRVIMHWQYRSLARDPGSLFSRVSEYTDHPENYIEVYGLRNHGVINDNPKTQIVYLHSKLMIIDDQVLICGSANINDRSMEGNRDSEICIYMDPIPDTIANIYAQQFPVASKIHSLRKRLWAEHFGLPEQTFEDPLNPIIKEKMQKISKMNTQIYRELFGCYPDNNIEYFHQIKVFRRNPTLQQYRQKIGGISGHVVEFPLFFLKKEKLTSFHPNAIST